MPTWMAPVAPAEIVAGRPLPYRVFLADKTLLASSGQRYSDRGRLEILRRQGWRILADEDIVSDGALLPDEALSRMSSQPTVRLEPRQRAPVDKATALVADDMRLSRSALQRMLRYEGITEAHGAATGPQAVTSFFQHLPDIVFLDIDMPGLDGLAVLERIKSWSPDTFVALFTGAATRDNVTFAKSVGVDACLVKPINGNGLKRVLSQYSGLAAA